ncbi:MAG: serine protease [Pseudomonadota bacterium]
MANENANDDRSKKSQHRVRQRGDGRVSVLLIVMVLLAVGFTAMQLRFMRTMDAVEERLDKAEDRAEAALQAAIPPQTVNEAFQSVYLVLRDGSPFGTAFVVDRERGVLATAAHVAEKLNLTDPDADIAVINRHTGVKIPIVGAKIHAGYGAFKQLAESYQPINPESKASSPKPVPLMDLPHDAALLLVRPEAPATRENRLGPNLPIADDETLNRLAPGDAVAVIGFASDIINATSLKFSAAPRSDRGIISAMLAPIDVVEDSGDPRFDSLIVHRMTGASGMSGGPLIDRDGFVVGIHSHGIASPESNGDSIAQRADLIRDMLTPLREEEQVATVLVPEWRRRLERWPRARDVFPPLMRAAYAPNYAIFAEKTVADILNEDQATEFRTVIDRQFGERVDDFVLPARELEPKTQRKRSKNAGSIQADAAQGFSLDGPGQFVVQRYRASAAYDHIIFAFDYTLGRYPICRLSLFARRTGEDALRASTDHNFPSFFIKAKRNEAGAITAEKKDAATIEIVAKRARCPYADDKFFIGIVSWDPTETDAPTADDAKDDTKEGGGDGGGLVAGLMEAGLKLKTFAVNAVSGGDAPTFTLADGRDEPLRIIAAEALTLDAFRAFDAEEAIMLEAATLAGDGLFSAPDNALLDETERQDGQE